MLDQLSGCECAYLAVKEAVKHGDKEALCGRGGGGCRGGGDGERNKTSSSERTALKASQRPDPVLITPVTLIQSSLEGSAVMPPYTHSNYRASPYKSGTPTR